MKYKKKKIFKSGKGDIYIFAYNERWICYLLYAVAVAVFIDCLGNF